MADPLAALDATAQADLVRRKQVSPQELVDAAIARIEKLNPELNAVISERFDKARSEAAAKSLPDGPFRGVPFLLKDLDATSAGDPFHCGIQALRELGWKATADSYLTTRFRKAGLVILGKTNTPELGLNVTTEPLAYGASRNPWNPEYSTGGSSGGSGAAVASGMVPVAHASDGGGSIRIPASECGLVGLKPSRGRVSLGPNYGEYWAGFVISHVVSRSVRDSAALLDAIAGAMPGDPYTAPPPRRPFAEEVGTSPPRLRVGLLTRSFAGPVHADCAAATHETGKALEALGHHVEEAHPEAILDAAMTEHFMTVVTCWVAAALDEWSQSTARTIGPAGVEPTTWTLAEMGRAVSGPRYIASCEWLSTYTRRMAEWWANGFDVLVTPTLGAPPPRLGELLATPEDPMSGMGKALTLIPFTPPFNITGQPALSLPLSWNRGGLPIGVQFVAAYGRDDLLIALGAQLEKALPWAEKRPPIHG